MEKIYLDIRMLKNRKAPSLVDLCVQKAIDNVRYLGDVGETDSYLLERILPHCTVDQLKHIENCTQERDLSPVTDRLWKSFYKTEFGLEKTNLVIERMKQKKVVFKWKELFEAKLMEEKERQERCFERIKQLYKKEDAKKQSRQVQLCTKLPPSSKKRSYFGGSGPNLGNTKSSLMKKSKLDFINSREVKNLAAMKTKAVQRNQSVSSVRRPGGFSSSSMASSSSSMTKPSKPMQGRF